MSVDLARHDREMQELKSGGWHVLVQDLNTGLVFRVQVLLKRFDLRCAAMADADKAIQEAAVR